MQTADQIGRQLQSARDLHSISRAMKALSAVRIRHSRRAVESLERYGRTVELALQIALRNRPAGLRLTEEDVGPRAGAVVFGSDLGLAGRFNIRITEHAVEHMTRLHPEPRDRFVIAVGARVEGTMERAGEAVAGSFPSPDSVDAIVGTVQELLLAIESFRTREGVDRFYLFYNHYHSGATYRPHMVHLLPLNLEWLSGLERRPWPSPVLPRFRVGWKQLFSELVREHLFVSLFQAAARSQAAENASRLASMEAAERRIEERIGNLQGRFNQQRQQGITEELLDLVTGFLASEDNERESRAEPSGALET
jgi:F-type H+-transporting ATPase subunit gamma